MKACLMKVNYDRKYTQPHMHNSKQHDGVKLYAEPLHARLTLTKEIYGPCLPERKHLRDTMEDAAKRKVRNSAPTTVIDAKEIARIQADAEKAHIDRYKKSFEENKKVDPYLFPHKLQREKENNRTSLVAKYEKHKEGVAKAYSTIKLQPLRTQDGDKNGPQPVWSKGSPTGNTAPPKPVHVGFKPAVIPQIQRQGPGEVDTPQDEDCFPPTEDEVPPLPPGSSTSLPNCTPPIRAQLTTTTPPGSPLEKAVKRHHSQSNFPLFSGLTEPADASPLTTVHLRVARDDDNDATACREHESSTNAAPYQRSKTCVPASTDFSGMYRGGHRAGKSTSQWLEMERRARLEADRAIKSKKIFTILGPYHSLRRALRRRGWVEKIHNAPPLSETYAMNASTGNKRNGGSKLSSTLLAPTAEEDEDYHATAVFGFIRFFVEKYKGNIPKTNTKKKISNVSAPIINVAEGTIQVQGLSPSSPDRGMRGGPVSVRALEVAMQQTELFLNTKLHDDIDKFDNHDSLNETQWDQFLMWYYQFVHDSGDISPVSEVMVKNCEELLHKVKEAWPQAQLDGTRNIWILKPCAKSRGRGIQIFDKLGMMMGYVDSNEGKVVLQKYIERPLLVYNTKFDIRQWFLVTDWNPLTLWFYKDSYLRFCSQQFTLDDLHISIHLANIAVQKKFKNASRAEQLPADNMWSSDTFKEYLSKEGHGDAWEEVIYPGMKQAIIGSVLCTQEHIEDRKGAFELYGADFMLSEDMQPWLLEINSSPSMARNSHVNANLVDAVLEDTLKVVLDRKNDKHCDTGRYELAYRRPAVNEHLHSDPSLFIQGKRINKKGGTSSSSSSSQHSHTHKDRR